MKKTLTLQPGMGDAILRHLQQFGALPERGVVAGQSVTSAILDLYAGGGGVYNDVDVFRKVTSGDVLQRDGMAVKTVGMTTVGLQTRTDGYGALEDFLDSVRSYRVSSVSRDGMLNFVNCALPGFLGRELSPARVIQSFDLNCVRAAVDLETRTLVWDRHFERFLHSRQLEIAAVHTPWHTFLRLLKKLEELPNVYADLATSAEAVAAVAQSQQYAALLYKGTVSEVFGDKNRKLAEQFRTGWEPYFSLDERAVMAGDTPIQLSTMTPRGQVDRALLERVNGLQGAALHFCAEAVYTARRKTSAASDAKLAQVREAARNARGVARCADMQGVRYVQGQVTDRHVQTVQAFFDAHMTMEDVMADLTLDEQFRTVKRLEALARERGNWTLGAIETRACANDIANLGALDLLLTQYEKERSTPIRVKPLKLPLLPQSWARKGWVVEELLTPLDLEDEGSDMGHCVGGYTGRVRSNNCRILRIRTGMDKSRWSTVELHAYGYGKIGPDVRMEVEQHRARFNKEPHADNAKLLRYVTLWVGAPWWQRLALRCGLEGHLGRLNLAIARGMRALVRQADAAVKGLRDAAGRLEEQGKTLRQE